MVIQEDIVAIGPQAGLRAQKRPDLIEGRPPDVPNAASGNLSPDRCKQPWRNHFDVYLWAHPSNLHFSSFFNCFNTTLLQVLKMIEHFFELVRRVSLPLRNLSDDANWIPGTV
jgi:hypothetical protein